MKRGMAGRTRRGAPPLPRQRIALRVVQLTLLTVAAFLGSMSYEAWTDSAATFPEALGPGVLAAMFLFGGAWMGLRTVRGPRPPDLDS